MQKHKAWKGVKLLGRLGRAEARLERRNEWAGRLVAWTLAESVPSFGRGFVPLVVAAGQVELNLESRERRNVSKDGGVLRIEHEFE